MRLRSSILLILFVSRCVDVSGNGNPGTLRRRTRGAKDECNFTFNVSGNGGTLTSPDFPDKYPSNADCRWLLTASDPNVTLLLRIDTLQIEPDTNCKLDFLQVYLGSNTLAPTLGPFCGNIKDRLLKTNSSTLLLVFHSDPVYEDKGFALDYFTHNAGDCISTLTATSGAIRSPGFPNNYPDNTDCWTLITVDQNKKILLNFDSVDMEYGENCTYDYVQIYDGRTRNSKLLGQICRRQGDTNFESSGNTLLLHFHSDESVNRKGYRARYSAIDKRSIMTGDCLWESDVLNGTIASPNYPANYPSNSNCTIWLQAPEKYWISIEFDALQMEIDTNCSYDYLQLKDGPPENSKLLGTFCGKISELSELKSTTNEVEIIFRSDDFAEFSGFKLRYSFVTNITESQPELSKAADPEKVSFETSPENATLPIGSPYMLRCSTRYPLAKIRWLKDDQFLSGGTPLPGLKVLGNQTLWIQSMDHHLTGQYTCVLVTAEKSISASAYILAESGSRNNDSTCGIVFRKVPKDASFAEGEFAYLECLAAGTNVQFTWEKDGKPIERSKRVTILQNGLLYVDRVTLDDAGIYSCIAYDEIAKCRKRASAFLQVSERAKIDEICGMPKAGKPSNDIPLMDHGKIVGGHNTKKGAYPWQVMLWEPTLKSFCGGSLLNERWIATAAHCFVHYQHLRWDRIVIKLGKYDREREEDEEFRTGIADPSSIVVHPAFNKVTFDNDLAVIRLRDHVRFSDYILPICIGDRELGERFLSTPVGRNSQQIQMGTVIGWGKLKESGPSPRYLQEIRLPIVDQKICKESTNYTVSRNMFCAGYAQEILGDACHGDSGGPFLMSHENRWYLLGIVSWGEGCGKANKYGFYTRIPNYLPWIKGIMKS